VSVLVQLVAVLILAIGFLVVWTVVRKPAKAEDDSAQFGRSPGISAESLAARRSRHAARSDSARTEEPAIRASASGDQASRGSGLAEDYYRKVDDLLAKVDRERRQLSSAKRLTSAQAALLSQIQAKLGEVRSAVGTLQGAPNDDSRRAAKTVLDNKLAEIRRMFGGLKP
jgi:hypothetical protein